MSNMLYQICVHIYCVMRHLKSPFMFPLIKHILIKLSLLSFAFSNIIWNQHSARLYSIILYLKCKNPSYIQNQIYIFYFFVDMKLFPYICCFKRKGVVIFVKGMHLESDNYQNKRSSQSNHLDLIKMNGLTQLPLKGVS